MNQKTDPNTSISVTHQVANEIREALTGSVSEMKILRSPNLCWTVDTPTFIALCHEQIRDPSTVRELRILGLRIVPAPSA